MVLRHRAAAMPAAWRAPDGAAAVGGCWNTAAGDDGGSAARWRHHQPEAALRDRLWLPVCSATTAPPKSAFDDFLKRFPTNLLSGNAQYWLGETHFVRGQYKAAAGAFLKGYQTYTQSAKAPDSLLKLAMSLDRLGQKDAACSSYSELNTKFPNAPQSVKARAQSERQRVGCP